jgi:hypothetical protein
MIRTISMIIGIMIAMVFFGMVIYKVLENHDDTVTISGITESRDVDGLQVSWSTDFEASGVLHRSGQSGAWTEQEEGYKRLHRVRARGLSGNVSYSIESCTADGICASSETMVGSFIRRTCQDGTYWDECSSVKPIACKEGILTDACRDCGCQVGICISNGSCVNRTT